MHDHHRHSQLGAHRHHLWVAQAGDIVDQVRSLGDRDRCHPRMPSVDGHEHRVIRGERRDHRQDAAQLLGFSNGLSTRPGGLTPDVDHQRASRSLRPTSGDRDCRLGMNAAVGKRVRGDVDDSHDRTGRPRHHPLAIHVGGPG